MPSFRTESDLPVHHWLRMGLLGLLGLALAATLMSLVLAASRYVRMPDGVVHARRAPKPQPVNPDDFLEKLGSAPTGAADAAGATTTAGAPGGAERDTDAANRRYAEEVQSMMRCAHAFAVKVGRAGPEPDAAAVEDFRAQFEKVAAASPDRGEPWASDVSQFVCATLEGKDAADLARAGKLDQPLVSAVNWHIAQWDASHRKVREFEAQEKRRIENESAAEARRVEEARRSVSSAVDAAAMSFGLVLALAICLALAGIESSLRGIRDSLEDLASRDFGGASPPLPLVSEEVDAPAAAADRHAASALDSLDMDDPLEVEYRIPEEAIGRI